jgi:multiple sugar transport system permease protein
MSGKPQSMNNDHISAMKIRELGRTKYIKGSLIGYAFISPWLIGFLGFIVGPMVASFYFSFTDYDMLSSPKWIGFDNYITMFTNDNRFIAALIVTFKFVFISVPLKLAFALFIALLFNGRHRGTGFYRTIYYIPSIIGGSVAIAVMWRQLFGLYGVVNEVLGLVGIHGTNWIASVDYAIWTLILLVIWQFGSPMLIFLAGLKQIPADLYEAAAIDGANRLQQFFKITLPMLTPIIFFNLVMQMVHGFMAFTQSFLITLGGPLDSTLFYAVYLYEKAFRQFEMGYASAMAWILLIIVSIITALIFKSSSAWVYYESEGGK